MKKYAIFFMIMLITTASCKKGFLEEKPNKLLVVPKSLKDFQSLLDNSNVMNNSSSLQLLSTDDFYTTTDGFSSMEEYERKAYTWDKDFVIKSSDDWSTGYIAVFYANVVLDGLNQSDQTLAGQDLWNTIKGTALFYRAFAYYNLAQVFASAYQETTAMKMPGIPLRLTADVNKRPERGTVKQVYDQILQDLLEAEPLLPNYTGYITRPSKTASLALIARIYQTMGDYVEAEKYADLSLNLNPALLDYNTLDPKAGSPFNVPIPNTNPEMLFYAPLIYTPFLYSGLNIPDQSLFQSYQEHDLRKTIFFTDPNDGLINFKGTYCGNGDLFGGIANDEVYLIKAECLAKGGKTQQAMDKLNTLLITRWQTGKFVKYTAVDSKDALRQILQERRKELFARGLRWTDLRRLNQEPEYAITLKRSIDGKNYELGPGDVRYTLPIPQDELLYSGLVQNPR